jgi:putative PIN family toxin of toxin-antitoxin system
MIRAVFDTNIVISGYLWSGAPRQALRAVEESRVQLLISEAMLDELKEVLGRPKFVERLKIIGKSAEQIVYEHLLHVEIIEAAPISPVVKVDPDDDIVLACASSGKAAYIVSGDPHLLDVITFQNIPILTVNAFLERLP